MILDPALVVRLAVAVGIGLLVGAERERRQAEEPVPGRMYRIPCRCGNTIILQLDAAAVDVGPSPLPFQRRTGPPPLPSNVAVPPRRIARPWPPPDPVQELEAPRAPPAARLPRGASPGCNTRRRSASSWRSKPI